MPDISDSDRDLIARTVLSEAGNDGPEGMAAVAHVIKNRIDSGRYGKTASDVVLAPKQFEPWSLRRNDPNHPSRWSTKSDDYQQAAGLVDSVFSGQHDDPTGGATHFFSPSEQAALRRKPPDWAKGSPLAQVGRHQFFAPEGAVTPDLLGEWGTGARSAAPAAPGAQAGDDLLGEWGTEGGGAAPAGGAPTRLTVTKAPPSPDQSPDAVQDLARFAAEHQGDTWTDTGARLGAGALRGVGDVADTLGQGIAAIGSGGAGALERLGALSPQHAQTVRDWAASVNQGISAGQQAWEGAAGESPMAETGRLAGQIAGTGPFLAGRGIALAGRPVMSALATGGLMGAGASALTSATSPEPLASQVGTGAALGGALGPLGYGASAAGRGLRNLLFGNIDPATARLALQARHAYDIPVTAGQMSNTPFVRFADSVLQRLPFTGYGARTEAQQAGVNRAVAQRFGEHTDAITTDTIRDAKQRLGPVFDGVAAQMGHIPVDRQGVNDIVRIVQGARVAPQNITEGVERLVDNVLSSIDPATHTMSAANYQALTRKGAPLNLAQKGGERTIAHYANQLREAVDDMMERHAPAHLIDDLREARTQWRAMKTIEPAANKAGPEGIRPALLQGLVNKGYPPTSRHPGPTETALREISQISQRFIKEPPSSGTSERMLAMHLAGLGLAGLGAAHFDPENFQRDITLGALGLGAGRVGSAALRSNWLANALIHAPLPPNLQNLPAITGRLAPLPALTFRDRSAGQ